MKIESCFKICGQVNKIYTAYEVLLVDIKWTLCSFLLISALCYFFSNPLSFCSWVCCHVCRSRFHLCSRCPSPCSAPLPICLLPHHLRNSRHVSCPAVQLFHTYTLSTFHHCQPPLYFLPRGRHIRAKISGGLVGRDWQGLWHTATACQSIQNLG